MRTYFSEDGEYGSRTGRHGPSTPQGRHSVHGRHGNVLLTVNGRLPATIKCRPSPAMCILPLGYVEKQQNVSVGVFRVESSVNMSRWVGTEPVGSLIFSESRFTRELRSGVTYPGATVFLSFSLLQDLFAQTH